MTQYRKPERGRVAKDMADVLELVGDPSGLSESFFDALARLLLEIAEAQKPSDDTEHECRSADSSN